MELESQKGDQPEEEKQVESAAAEPSQESELVESEAVPQVEPQEHAVHPGKHRAIVFTNYCLSCWRSGMSPFGIPRSVLAVEPNLVDEEPEPVKHVSSLCDSLHTSECTGD